MCVKLEYVVIKSDKKVSGISSVHLAILFIKISVTTSEYSTIVSMVWILCTIDLCIKWLSISLVLLASHLHFWVDL